MIIVSSLKEEQLTDEMQLRENKKQNVDESVGWWSMPADID